MQRVRRFVLVAACAILIDGAFGAYLPQLGPSPLRFVALAGDIVTAPSLPPLHMDGPIAVTNVVPTNSAVNILPAETLEPFGPQLPDLTETNVNAAATNSAALEFQLPVSTEGSAIITPQMLADFLRKLPAGTNAPFDAPPAENFVPPLPPSSSATYRSK